MRYLGIDYGSRKTGLALSDEAGVMGFPYAVVPTDGRLIDEVLKVIEQKNVTGVVMGDSRNSEGEENMIAHDAREFSKLLTARTGLSVAFEMEAFTTQEARRARDTNEKSRKPKDASPVDASAAALILTSYLNHAPKQP